MNAKPTIAQVKARDSQLSVADLKDRFDVLSVKWLVSRKRGQLWAWTDTPKNRERMAKNGFELIRAVGGVSRNSAVKMVRRSLVAK